MVVRIWSVITYVQRLAYIRCKESRKFSLFNLLVVVSFGEPLVVLAGGTWLGRRWCLLSGKYAQLRLSCKLSLGVLFQRRCKHHLTVCWSDLRRKKNGAPDAVVGKRHVWLFSTAGHEWVGEFFSGQTSWAGAMRASKFVLPAESAGPSCQESSSSSHHSDVFKIDVPLWPPMASSRGCFDPIGIILKKALGCRMVPPLPRDLDSMWKTSTLLRTSPQPDTPPATIKWSSVEPQPGPRLFFKRFGQASSVSGLASPFVTEYPRTLCVSLIWIVTNLVLDTIQPHSADVVYAGPATQLLEPGARNNMPSLYTIKTPCPSMFITPRTPSPRVWLVNVPRSHWADVTLSVRQSVESGFPIHHPPHTASCGGWVGAMKDPKPYRVSGKGGIKQSSKPKVSMEVNCPSFDWPPSTRRPGRGEGSSPEQNVLPCCYILTIIGMPQMKNIHIWEFKHFVSLKLTFVILHT